MEQKRIVWDGNMAASQAMRQAKIDVVAAYPITPSTPVVQNYSQFEADGDVEGEFVMVESEHSAMSACVGAAAAGGRVATATSSQGYALMVEVLYQASGMRLPIVMNVVNRALAAPLNIHGDMSDMYLGRDAGWINLVATNPQEVYDLNLCAFKIAEDYGVRLPVAVNQMGFDVSHTTEALYHLPDEDAYNFIGDYKPLNAMLDSDNPATYGAQTEGEWHYEHKMRHEHAMYNSFGVIEDTLKAYKDLTGREYKTVETYMVDDAEEIIVCMGSTAGTTQITVDKLRAEGKKVGLISIRLWRPFPKTEVAKYLGNAKTITVLDKSAPLGSTGALFQEIAAVMVDEDISAVLLNYIYGLGGRDLTISMIEEIYAGAKECSDAGKRVKPLIQTINLRGPELSFY
ncbi:MAG: 2-oxoacid:ferredoxin oxidoreductase subunit alpha [Campylobacterales bacterium]|nr:2-oxoacid:ferredoxin oxidoreductase subunit alpha [Campylobacterales bacterium]